MSAVPFRSVITGGPGAGKSTLLAEIASKGIATFPEVARGILKAPGGMAMRAAHPLEFATAMLEAEREAWDAAKPGLSVYDRGFPDIAGFLDIEGLPIPRELDRACRELRYSGPVFRAPAWQDIYAPDEERIQNWDEAVASDLAITAAWRRYGYKLVDLPLVTLPDRVSFLLDHIEGAKSEGSKL
jgi:predicted ATPase